MVLKVKEKEEALKLKELRRELQEKISEHLPTQGEKEIKVHVEQLDEALAIDENTAKRVVEALLFSTSKPITPNDIKRVLKGYTAVKIQKIVDILKEEYENEDRSFKLVEIAGGYEIATEPRYAPWIMKIELQKKARQATASALETLAILAYKQPITRAEIEDIRGVNASSMVANLLEKGFIKIVGRKEVPGRPMLYGTTDKFLSHFGLKSVNDLPDISEIKDLVENAIRREELIIPQGTVVNSEDEELMEGTSEELTSSDGSSEEVVSAGELEIKPEIQSQEVTESNFGPESDSL